MPLQTKVFLEPNLHQYFDGNGNQYLSVSKVLDLVKPLFERDKLSAMTANKRGISQAEVLAEWTATEKLLLTTGPISMSP